MGQELLRGHSALRTHDPDELRQWLGANYAVREFDLPAGSQTFHGAANYCCLPSLDLAYLDYGAPMRASLEQLDFFVQGIPVAGDGRVSALGKDVTVGIDYGTTSGPGSGMKLDYAEGFQHLTLKIAPEVLSAKLAALIDGPVDPPIQLEGPSGNRHLLATQARLIRFLASEVERGITKVAPLMLAELEQAILVSYLEAYDHNYSHLLRGTPRTAAPWQVKRAVDYIEAHWDEPLTVEVLALASGTSARSLFHLFRRTYGHSPMVHVNRVRLRHAHAMLRRPAPGTTVSSVGFECGFSNLGSFAHRYRQAYGENPSDTLRRHQELP